MASVNEEFSRNRPGLSRRQRAARTRTAIIEAAHVEFAKRGYHATTMASIAARAGVAVQTVYFVFRTKPNLLADVIGASVMGLTADGEFAENPEESDWYFDAMNADDGSSALERFVTGGIPIFSRTAAVADAARVAGQTDDDARAVYARGEEYRRTQFGRFVRSLDERGLLRHDLDVERATDILMTMFGSQTYLSFTSDHGWTPPEFADWLTGVLPAMLLERP